MHVMVLTMWGMKCGLMRMIREMSVCRSRESLGVPRKKRPGVPLHIVTDSELVFLGLKGKCENWKRHKWVGSRGPMSHVDLWSEMWD